MPSTTCLFTHTHAHAHIQVRQHDPGMVAMACYQCALDMINPRALWETAKVLALKLEEKFPEGEEEEAHKRDVQQCKEFQSRLPTYVEKGVERCGHAVSLHPDDKKGIFLSEVRRCTPLFLVPPFWLTEANPNRTCRSCWASTSSGSRGC